MAKTTTAPAEVRVTKMDQARDLYREIVAKAAPEGSTHRGIFMDRAQVEIGLTKSGANTYFQKLKDEGAAPMAKSSKPAAAGRREQLKELATLATELNRKINTIAKQVA